MPEVKPSATCTLVEVAHAYNFGRYAWLCSCGAQSQYIYATSGDALIFHQAYRKAVEKDSRQASGTTMEASANAPSDGARLANDAQDMGAYEFRCAFCGGWYDEAHAERDVCPHARMPTSDSGDRKATSQPGGNDE